jgi:polar amino acid transport system substrate-binding protein
MTTIDTFTRGYGFDKIIITAGASSNDPIELSAVIAKKKGTIVVVGAVKMDIPRDPHFYRKELDLRMSCSYGPGRYDEQYEQYGNDYPYAYVRWTEQRNMEAFLDMVSLGRIDLMNLITHIFDINDAVSAYDLILGKRLEPYVGILLKYSSNSSAHTYSVELKRNTLNKSSLSVSFIGAGSFAQSYLLPNLKKLGVSLCTVVTNTGINAKNVAEKFSFQNASTNADKVFSDDTSDVIFIASRHDSHAEYLSSAIKLGKHVFVEKPLCINYDEYNLLKPLLLNPERKSIVMVGFNRRFSPLAIKVNEIFKDIKEPLMINMRINAGLIPKDHWIQQSKVGGGRIIGEICHFIDLMQYFSKATPINVYANCLNSTNSKEKNDDNIVICVQFSDGSIGNLVYIANGDKALPKEQIEVFGAGKVGIINDFRSAMVYSNNQSKKIALVGKGHKEEVSQFIESIKNKGVDPISAESLLYTTITTFKIIDSLITGLPQKIEI